MLKHAMAVAAVAAAITCTSAHADLMNTEMDLSLSTDGFVGTVAGPVGGTHTWGHSDLYNVVGGSQFISVTSPTPLIATKDNALLIDFSGFAYMTYTQFGPATSTLTLTGIDEHIDTTSVALYLPSNPAAPMPAAVLATDDSITVSWDVDTVVSANMLSPQVLVTWDSAPVPAAGPLALLGLAGVCARRRR
jgi:MYXO-CTERM domain-containing protein